MCVCVRVREREREREREGMYVQAGVKRERGAYVCECVLDRERQSEQMFQTHQRCYEECHY